MRNIAAGAGASTSSGGSTAMKSRREALDDAIHATRAVIAKGIVPGAWLALLRAIPAVDAVAAAAEGDERSGAAILRRALEAPTRQIAENSGADGGVVVEKMRGGPGAFGFDAAAGRYVDLMEHGIIDPTKVVRLALENAVSVAGILLLTEATMTEVPDEKKDVRRGWRPCKRRVRRLPVQGCGGTGLALRR